MSIPLTSTQLFNRAYLILFFSLLSLVYAAFTTLGCVRVSVEGSSSYKIARLICEDNHYRYLLPLLIPSGAYYIIANWVGWEYFRYA